MPALKKSLEGTDPDPDAQRHIEKVAAEHNAQFLALRQQSQSLFASMKGRTGTHTPEGMAKLFLKAKSDYLSGAFLLDRLGTCRFTDPELVAVLLELRDNLLEELSAPTANDRMHIDLAILSYRNVIRIQNLLSSTLLEIERQLFGQLSLNEVLGGAEAREVEMTLERIEHKLLPLLARSQNMMNRALDRLETRRPAKGGASVMIGVAGQVNVGDRNAS